MNSWFLFIVSEHRNVHKWLQGAGFDPMVIGLLRKDCYHQDRRGNAKTVRIWVKLCPAVRHIRTNECAQVDRSQQDANSELRMRKTMLPLHRRGNTNISKNLIWANTHQIILHNRTARIRIRTRIHKCKERCYRYPTPQKENWINLGWRIRPSAATCWQGEVLLRRGRD